MVSSMLRWCAYCQTFLGESAPFADFSVTHGICHVCVPKFQSRTVDMDRAQALANLFNAIWSTAKAGLPLDELQVLRDAKALGIRSVDFFVGMVQPMLYEIGQLWETGRTSVATEHRFSTFADGLLTSAGRELAPKSISRSRKSQDQADVLLFKLAGNDHVLGLRMIDLFLREEGFAVKIDTQERSSSEILNLVQTHKPFVVGFSVALPHHVPAMRTLVTSLRNFAPNAGSPTFAVGGGLLLQNFALGRELEQDDFLVYNGNLQELAAKLLSLKNGSL